MTAMTMTMTRRLRRSLSSEAAILNNTAYEYDADRSYDDTNKTDPEWLTQEVQDDECTMDCQNGGDCQLGRAIHGFSSELLEDEDKLHFNAYNTSMHCVCPTGWTGLYCEINLVECQQDTCFNGKKCLLSEDDHGMPFRHCECDAQQTDFSLPYAAHFCGQTATTFCADDKIVSSHSFCKNGGKCLGVISKSQQE